MEMLAINISVAEIVEMLIMTLGVVIVIIVILSYRTQYSIRLHAAHQKIDELSERMKEQETVLLNQQHLYDLDKRLVNIRTHYLTPAKNWTNYHSMLQDIDHLLNGWMAAFGNHTQLAYLNIITKESKLLILPNG